jgi:two-component system, OmpR family, KDP operon response regulator KdpE
MTMVHNGRHASMELPPPVGTRLLVVSRGLERGYLRSRVLEEVGYRVATCGEPGDIHAFASQLAPDAILIDLGRNNGNLADFVRVSRPLTDGPLAVIGSTGDITELLTCLEAGADEVYPPRTSTQELDLRLRALLRILARQVHHDFESSYDVLRVGDLEIDPERRLVKKRGEVVALSPTEFRLLVTLAENAGRVVPSKALIARVWGDQYASETHYLRLYVRYLRQKLEDDPSHPIYIVNRWGSGYALEEPAKAA